MCSMPDIVVWLESTIDIALCVKYKMAAICANHKFINFQQFNKKEADSRLLYQPYKTYPCEWQA